MTEEANTTPSTIAPEKGMYELLVGMPTLGTLYKILDQGLYIPGKDETANEMKLTGRIPDRKKLIEFMRQEAAQNKIKSRERRVELNNEVPNIEELKDESRRILNDFLLDNARPNRADLSQEIKEEVLINLPREIFLEGALATRGSDVQIEERKDDHGGAGWSSENGFASKPDVVLTSEGVKEAAEYLKYMAQKAGVNINEDSLIDAAIAVITIHEWAHSLEIRFGQLFVDRAMEMIPRGFPVGSVLFDEARSQVFKSAREFVLNHGDEILNDSSVNTERLAVGFEKIGLLHSLVKNGVDIGDAKKLLQVIADSDNQALKAFKSVFDNYGLTPDQWHKITDDLDFLAIHADLPVEYLIPNLPGHLGYVSGYTPEELKTILLDVATKIGPVTVSEKYFAKTLKEIEDKNSSKLYWRNDSGHD